MKGNPRLPQPPPYPEPQKLWCSSLVQLSQNSPIVGHVSANCSWSFRQDGSVHTSVEATKDTNVARFFAKHFTELQAMALFDQNESERHRDPGQVGDIESWKYARSYWRRQEDIKNLSLGPGAFLLRQQSGGPTDQIIISQNAAAARSDSGSAYLGLQPEAQGGQQARAAHCGEADRSYFQAAQANRANAEKTIAGVFQDRGSEPKFGGVPGSVGNPYRRDNTRVAGLARRRDSIMSWEHQRNMDLLRIKVRDDAARRRETEEDRRAFPRLPVVVPAVKMPQSSPAVNLVVENVPQQHGSLSPDYKAPQPDAPGYGINPLNYRTARTPSYDSDKELMSDENSGDDQTFNDEQGDETLKVD